MILRVRFHFVDTLCHGESIRIDLRIIQIMKCEIWITGLIHGEILTLFLCEPALSMARAYLWRLRVLAYKPHLRFPIDRGFTVQKSSEYPHILIYSKIQCICMEVPFRFGCDRRSRLLTHKNHLPNSMMMSEAGVYS